jgi:1-acyl-sn-glycerol-3-phosphate acyltransferase
MPFGPTYDIINTLARWSLNSYFHTITISNPHEVPPTGPVIVAANHWNMTIDVNLIPFTISRVLPTKDPIFI